MNIGEADATYAMHLSGMSIYHSKRSIPLLWMKKVTDGPVLTVENYVKWYSLFVIWPSDSGESCLGKVTEVGFEHLAKHCRSDETYCGDHVPNPIVVRRFAEANGYHMDENALEMIIGRWELEYLETNSRYYPEEVP